MARMFVRLGCLTVMAVACCLYLPGCEQPPPETPEAPVDETTAAAPVQPEPASAPAAAPEPEEPENPGDALELTHVLSPAQYTPGAEIEVVVDMDYIGDDPITALAVRQIAPPGWTFVAVTGGIQPAVTPRIDATGTLDFVWITTPDWPNNFSYALQVPEDMTGDATITGQGIYRTSGPELRTTAVELRVPQAEAPSPN